MQVMVTSGANGCGLQVSTNECIGSKAHSNVLPFQTVALGNDLQGGACAAER